MHYDSFGLMLRESVARNSYISSDWMPRFGWDIAVLEVRYVHPLFFTQCGTMTRIYFSSLPA